MLSTNTSPTYAPVEKLSDGIIQEHLDFMQKNKIQVSDKQIQLPFLMWIPKMHKKPSKQRYIAVSNSCTTKPLSSTITTALRLIETSHRKYCARIQQYTGINMMWIIKNSQAINQTISDINARKSARNVDTHDFATLYTSIPHDKLKTKIRWVVEKAFHGSNRKFMTFYKDSARWTVNPSKKHLSVDCETLINWIEWLIDNVYVTFGAHVFRQIIGIPMGTDCAPFLANLFLYAYEFEWLSKMCKNKTYHIAHKFNKCFRYIDDLLCFNNDGLMQKYMHDIYPPELILKLANPTNQAAPFLHLFLWIEDDILQYRIYDKRDDFDFVIVNFPFLCGNDPTTQSYGVFTSQIIRYARGCMHVDDFVSRCQTLSSRLIKQNFRKHRLRLVFRKFQGRDRYKDLLLKYANKENLVNTCVR
jgi:hypothetical protein